MKPTVSLYAGGFKPPHKAHFENAVMLGNSSDKLIIFIGSVVREGITITPKQSAEIWKIYLKYLPANTDIVLSKGSPIKDIYDYVDAYYDTYSKIITGSLPEELKKFAYFKSKRNKEKYLKVELVELPRIGDEENKLSASAIRTQTEYLEKGEWIPSQLSTEDKENVINVIKYEISTRRSNKEHA